MMTRTSFYGPQIDHAIYMEQEYRSGDLESEWAEFAISPAVQSGYGPSAGQIAVQSEIVFLAGAQNNQRQQLTGRHPSLFEVGPLVGS